MEINKENRVLAIDGDILAYRTAAVCEDHFEGSCDAILHSTIKEIVTNTHINKVRVYISGEDNFRYKISKTKPYKGNRATMVRPKFLTHCKRFLVENYNGIMVHGYEADDAIATDMTRNNAIHCGIDKDILQIAGDHYNYVKKEWQHVTPEEATLNLFRQVLTGDNSDNVPGLPRVGAKTAEAIIYNHETAMEDAISYYREICEERLPDVEWKTYFEEQYALIAMVKDVDLFTVFTKFVEAETEGFEEQDGEFVTTSEEVVEKKEPKL